MRCLLYVNGELVGITRGESMDDARADALSLLWGTLTPVSDAFADRVAERCGIREVPPCACGLEHGRADAGDLEHGAADARDYFEARLDDVDGEERRAEE